MNIRENLGRVLDSSTSLLVLMMMLGNGIAKVSFLGWLRRRS